MTRQVETVRFWRGVLPHWEVADGRYFVTLRLANSLPRHVVNELSAQLLCASEQDYLERARAYFTQIESWLDRNDGHTWLQQEEIAIAVMASIDHYGSIGCWHMAAGVIMPNHLHLFFRCGDRSLAEVMRGFKRYTSKTCNQLLEREGQRFWQREWFDHWSRSAPEDDKIVSYIRRSPARAGLVQEGDRWPWVF